MRKISIFYLFLFLFFLLTNITYSDSLWNTKELDPYENGNVITAIKLIKSKGRNVIINNAVTKDAYYVTQAPWDYYGKICKFSGRVTYCQNFPPSSEFSKALGGNACEINIFVDDTNVTGLIFGSGKTIHRDDWITLFGYPCGVTEGQNAYGGSVTSLYIVGVKNR